MTARPLSIDVVVAVHNGWTLTQRCLSCLAEQTTIHSVIVSDNGSTDGTPCRIRREFPKARVLELGANLGFPRACNAGAAAADGEVVVLLNNDVECRPDFLERLVEPLQRDERVGSVAALLVTPAQRRGPASIESSLSGMRATDSDGTTTYSA